MRPSYPEYHVWYNMLRRCNNKSHPKYPRYGGRGITVCKEWSEFGNFYRDMGDRPARLQIDRIDNNKGYYKDNCRWVTHKANIRNSNVVKLTSYSVSIIKRLLEDGGLTGARIAKLFGVKSDAISLIKRGACWSDIKHLSPLSLSRILGQPSCDACKS